MKKKLKFKKDVKKNKGGQHITIDDIEFLYAENDDDYIDAVENGYMSSYLYGSMYPEKEHMITYKN